MCFLGAGQTFTKIALYGACAQILPSRHCADITVHTMTWREFFSAQNQEGTGQSVVRQSLILDE